MSQSATSIPVVSTKNPNLMSARELAVYLGKRVEWVYQNKEQIPHRRVGRTYFFHRDRVDEWMRGDWPNVVEAKNVGDKSESDSDEIQAVVSNISRLAKARVDAMFSR